MAIVYITPPNNAAWQAAVEKKILMFFENVIEFEAGSKEPIAGSNEKPVSAGCVFEAVREYFIRSY